MKDINSFSKKYFYLSNFSSYGFVDELGIYWQSVEHYYQAHKTNDMKQRTKIMCSETAGESKKLGRKCKLRSDWEKIKIPIMRKALKFKFDQNKDIKKKLLATKDSELIEGNHWGDTFWGVCDGHGLNMLGELLMDLRKDYGALV